MGWYIGLLEDNPDIAEVLTIALKGEGYTLATFTHGASFLQALVAGPAGDHFDLCLIDLHLPDMSGIEVIDMIHQTYQLPCIAMSAAVQALAQVEARFPGLPVLHKPFRLAELFQAIVVLLEQAYQRAKAV